MLFSQTLVKIDNEIAELLAQIEAKKQQQAQLTELDALTDSTLEGLADVVSKVGHYDRNAIATLKSAVLQLFTDDGNDDGNQPTAPTPEPTLNTFPRRLKKVGGNQPIDPTPKPDDSELNNGGNQVTDPIPETDDSEPELHSLNGTTGDKDDEEFPVDDPIGNEWILASDTPLQGQTCAIDPELYWEITPPDGSSCELTSPKSCLLWEDAPLTGQHCTITPKDNENADTERSEVLPQPSSTEMIHTSARTGYLKLKASGQILAAYAWFPRKDLAIAWEDWLDGMSLGFPELRPSKRNLSWKYEIKLTGLSMTQIERLSGEDLSRKPSKKKVSPAQAAGIEPPSDWGKVQPKENPSQLYAKVLLAESEYCGQTLPVSRVSPNEMGYTLTLPNGDNHWYRADMVQLVNAEIEAIAEPTEPVDPIIPKLIESLKACTTYERYMELWHVCGVGTVSDAFNLLPQEDKERIKALRPIKSQPTELIEFNDLVEVVADGNDTVGLVGSFGRVKVIKGDRVGVEIDEQLVFFKKCELSIKAKAEVPPSQQQQLQSGQILIGNRIVTNGNYIGAARRNAIANARRGTASKIAALELMKAGLSPELALATATGTNDDASDF